MDQEIFQALGLSLGLGLLVGLQRERAESRTAGIRTFAIITLLGTICAFLAQEFGGWIVAAGFLSTAALVVVANIVKLHGKDSESEPGQTTEASALLMFGLGAYVAVGNQAAAVAVGGTIAVLLHLKEPLHSFVDKIGEHDIRAVMQFVAITFVILPVLPDRAYGPYDVLNPHDIWRMVVLIVGIGIAGYIAYKLFGQKAGSLLGGVLGGLISSTATTVSYARRTADSPKIATLAAIVVMIASTIAFVRVIFEVAAIAPKSLGQIAPPLGAMLVIMILISAAAYFFKRDESDEMPEQENPAEIKSALIFGALYAVITFGVAAARDYFGNSGLYVVAVISGLTNVDAITLSTSKLVKDGRMETDIAWRIILIASLANLFFKGGVIAVLGHKRLLRHIVLLFGIAIASGLAILWFWPSNFMLG